MEYDSQKLIEVVDLELDKQKKTFEEKKEHFENSLSFNKEKKYLQRRGSLFDKVIKSSN
jgi:hypothetical protein